MKYNELIKQSIDFSVSIVEYYKWLISYKKEIDIIFFSTSQAPSRKNIISISSYTEWKEFIKEASETEYWLIILEKTDYLLNEYDILKIKCLSLKKMLISSLNTTKGNS